MIYESYPWKCDLSKRCETLKKYTHKPIKTDDDYTKVEKAIIYSAFIIRKLIDCHSKTSDEVDKYVLNVESIPSVEKMDIANNWIKESTHNWNRATSETISAKNMCNQLIHSFVFSIDENEDGTLHGFFVSSDYDRNKKLFSVNISEWINLIDFVVTDDIVEMRIKYDPAKNERVLIKKQRGIMEVIND